MAESEKTTLEQIEEITDLEFFMDYRDTLLGLVKKYGDERFDEGTDSGYEEGYDVGYSDAENE